jgi:hypothetical protein
MIRIGAGLGRIEVDHIEVGHIEVHRIEAGRIEVGRGLAAGKAGAGQGTYRDSGEAGIRVGDIPVAVGRKADSFDCCPDRSNRCWTLFGWMRMSLMSFRRDGRIFIPLGSEIHMHGGTDPV